MFRNLILWLPLIFILSACKNKYKAAFQEIDKRDYYSYPIEGDRDEIILLTDAIKYKPELHDLYYQRAVHYQLLGEYENSLKDYRVCAANHFTFAQLYLDKGLCEYHLNQLEPALQDLRLARKHFDQEWKESPIEEHGHWTPEETMARERIDSTIKATTEAIYQKK